MEPKGQCIYKIPTNLAIIFSGSENLTDLHISHWSPCRQNLQLQIKIENHNYKWMW